MSRLCLGSPHMRQSWPGLVSLLLLACSAAPVAGTRPPEPAVLRAPPVVEAAAPAPAAAEAQAAPVALENQEAPALLKIQDAPADAEADPAPAGASCVDSRSVERPADHWLCR